MRVATAPRPAPPETLLARIVQFPLIRIAMFAAGIAAALVVVNQLMALIAGALGDGWPVALVRVVLSLVAVHLVYRGLTRLLEGRSADELAGRGAPNEMVAGAVIGAGLLAVTVAFVTALGYYHVEGTAAWTALLTAFGIAATSGYIEEVIFRGVLFRIVEEGLGTWAAFAVSVAFFGFAHLSNPNATVYGAVAIGIEAGMLLGAAYVVTRRLWLPIGIHFGWNFMQAGVFGPNLSGHEVGSVLQSRLSGPDLLSGGALGVEGSLFAVVLCAVVSVLFLMKAQRRGQLVQPFWRRNRSY